VIARVSRAITHGIANGLSGESIRGVARPSASVACLLVEQKRQDLRRNGVAEVGGACQLLEAYAVDREAREAS
jgi:hypothetical protein